MRTTTNRINTTILAALLILAAILYGFTSQAQSVKPARFKMDKNGKIQVDTARTRKGTIKHIDSIFQIVDGITFYKGARGAVYYWRTSKKTGQPYKCYIKPEGR